MFVLLITPNMRKKEGGKGYAVDKSCQCNNRKEIYCLSCMYAYHVDIPLSDINSFFLNTHFHGSVFKFL
jgi:hypothetical protein